MTTANRFSPLFKSDAKSSAAKSSVENFPSLEEAMQVLEKVKQEPTASSEKKMPTKMIMGHRSYEEDLRSHDMERERKRTEAYALLADREKLGEKLTKTRMCNSLTTGQPCSHGDKCRFAHSLSELKISECTFADDCRFIRVWNRKLINNGDKICNHKHPQESVDAFIARVGLDRYNNRTQPTVNFAQPPPPMQPAVDFAQPPPPRQPAADFAQPPPPRQQAVEVAQPPPPRQPTVDAKSPDQVLIIRVPKELAAQALEIAMRSGKSSIQIEII